MTIITSVPYPNFIDGVTVASGSQVNANFGAILSQVNANAAANGANSDITSLASLTTPPAGSGSFVFAGGVATGSANAVVVASVSPTGYALSAGNRVTFIASAAPTGGTTLTVNGTTTEAVIKYYNGALVGLAGGEWSAGQVVEVLYDGTNYQLLTTTPTIQALFIGEVRWLAYSTVPSLWHYCDGSAISRTTYAKLFTAIGTVYGVGDGSTTFNLPDLRGQFLRGWSGGGGSIDPGRTFGSQQGFLTQDHNHAPVSGNFVTFPGAQGPLQPGSSSLTVNTNQTVTGPMASGAAGVETRPTNVAMLPIIYTGV